MRNVTDSAPTLQHWLDRLRDGDPAARNELIRHSRDRLKLLTRQMLRRFPGVRQWEESSDVLQNVLVRLDRALQAVAVPSPRDFLRLATTQIRRELIDLARHHFGPEGPGANLVPPGQIAPGETPPEPEDGSADPKELSRWHDLHCQIAGLDDEDRELFELLYYQGLKQADAAALLGVPLTTFKRRWRAARLRLMTRLGGDLPF
jgi:RNA polymerase sigma-70 factor (ECF subfamily)